MLTIGLRRLYMDIAADRTTLGAERNGERIAVEVQSFLGDSDIENLHHAVGQYAVYRVMLDRIDPDRLLFLAVAEDVYDGILSEQLGQLVIAALHIRLLVFRPAERRVSRWIS